MEIEMEEGRLEVESVDQTDKSQEVDQITPEREEAVTILQEVVSETENARIVVEPESDVINAKDSTEEQNVKVLPSVKEVTKESAIKTRTDCQKCGRSLSESQMKKHKCGKRTYSCSVCQESFSSQGALRNHVIVDHLTKFSCYFCSITFRDEAEYVDHMKTHLSNQSNVSVSTKESDSGNPKKDLHKCKSCTFVTKVKSVLSNHEDKCVGFKCNTCLMKFRKEEELSSHICGNKPKYQCGVCFVLFDDKDNLVVHLRSHKTKRSKDPIEIVQVDLTDNIDLNSVLYRCDECSFMFNNNSLYLEHMRTHTNQKNPEVFLDNVEHFMALTTNDLPYISKVLQSDKTVDFESLLICQACGDPFASKLDLEKHVCRQKNEELKYTVKIDEENGGSGLNILDQTATCIDYQEFLNSNVIEIQENCDKYFCETCGNHVPKNEEELHKGSCFLMKNKDKQDNLCGVCNEGFITKKALKAHEQVHQGKRGYSCQDCSDTFKTKKALKLHSESHPESYEYQCLACDQRFFKEKQLKSHQDEAHRDLRCRHCGKEASNKKALRNHEQRHNRAPNSSNFECEVCKRVFKTKTGLRHHLAVHTGRYKYFCDFCQRGFMSRMILEEHRSRHTKEDRYVCDVCGKKFNFQSTYWIHRKWHDNEYPYKCNFCGRLFRHSSLLAVHKRKHTGERPYKCPHCPLTFTVGGTLKRHLILHTKKFPYNCEACSRGFTTRHKYNVHLTKTHNYESPTKKSPPKTDFKVVLREKKELEKLDTLPSDSEPNNFEFTQNNFTAVKLEEDDNSAILTPSLITSGNDEDNTGHVFEIILETPLQQISSMLLNENGILTDMWCQ